MPAPDHLARCRVLNAEITEHLKGHGQHRKRRRFLPGESADERLDRGWEAKRPERFPGRWLPGAEVAAEAQSER